MVFTEMVRLYQAGRKQVHPSRISMRTESTSMATPTTQTIEAFGLMKNSIRESTMRFSQVVAVLPR